MTHDESGLDEFAADTTHNPQMYDQLEDVPRGITRVVSGDVNATYGEDARWYNQRGGVVPLDAHGPWRVVQREVATTPARTPEPAPVLWLDVVETKPMSYDDFWRVHDRNLYGDSWYQQYLDRFQPFRLVLKSAGNNEPLMWGESYHRRDDALHTARLIGSAGTTVYLRQPEHGNETLRLGVVDNGGTESGTGKVGE